jgi:hypothetical protein
MAYQALGAGALDYMPCRYGRTRLLFRGPRRDLSGYFVAALGGIETHGRYVPRPWPVLVEEATGMRVVNLGCPQAGPDAWLSDPALFEVLDRAAVVVVQVTAASDVTNRLYAVHPRRNDRFIRAAPLLQTVYRGVDFTDFSFTRHMLRALHMADPARFALVAEEVRAAWMARMGMVLDRIHGRKLLLWMGERAPPSRSDAPLGEPVLVDQAMLEALGPKVDGIALAVPSVAAQRRGTEGMVFPAMAEPAARGLPGVAVHEEVAQAVAAALRGMG